MGPMQRQAEEALRKELEGLKERLEESMRAEKEAKDR